MTRYQLFNFKSVLRGSRYKGLSIKMSPKRNVKTEDIYNTQTLKKLFQGLSPLY